MGATTESFGSAVKRTIARRFAPPAQVVEGEPAKAVNEHGHVFFSQFGEDAALRGYFRRKEEDRVRLTSGACPTTSPIGHGFYVDVGCYHPTRYSNTYYFYEQGWSGLNIDPTPGTKRLFHDVRPRDVTLELAVSTSPGEMTFYGPGGRSVFNTLSRSQAETYVRAGWFTSIVETTVRAEPLSAILDEHLPEGQEISLLDVDVEGHDAEVLRSNDWSKYRPELVLVECHSREYDRILSDERSRLMLDVGYVVHAWLPPNVVFRDAQRSDGRPTTG